MIYIYIYIIYIIYIILFILYYIIYIILYILCIHIYIYNIYITYIYIYIHTFKVKKTESFLGKFSPYEISCGESGDEMSLVKPEFSKLVMEIIFFNVYFMNRLTK